MPVLPDDGSRMVSPARSSPASSASSIILSAMRSFDEPPGFWPSSLAQILTPGFGDSWCTPISGGVPISPRIESNFGTRSRAARDGGEDRHGVAVLEHGVEAVEVADVVVVLVDVDESVQPARAVEPDVTEARIALDERAEHGADGVAVDGNRRLTVGLGA